jgi:Yip1 domain
VAEPAVQQSAEAVPNKGLVARLAGVVFAPKATYADVVARPRVLGALLVTLALMIGAYTTFFSTDVGRNAMLERQDRMTQSLGIRMSDAQYARMQQQMNSPLTAVFGAVSLLIFVPLVAAIFAGLIIAIFNAVMGGDATFKQVYAVVIHSQFLAALGSLFIYPLDYVRESLSSPTSLAVFFPFLDEGSFFARFFGIIDLFYIWVIVNLAIGLAVLYKRRTTPIAMTMLVLYAVVALCAAAIEVAFSGA